MRTPVVVQGAADDSEPTDKFPVVCRSNAWVFGRYEQMPCPHTYKTGFGGHILVEGEHAIAHVAGVELCRMGQTNVLGRCT